MMAPYTSALSNSTRSDLLLMDRQALVLQALRFLDLSCLEVQSSTRARVGLVPWHEYYLYACEFGSTNRPVQFLLTSKKRLEVPYEIR